MNRLKQLNRGLTINQTLLSHYRSLSDEELRDCFVNETASAEQFQPQHELRRKQGHMIMHPADSETYLQHFERVMALQAAILERPSSEHYPEYRELLLRSRGGCALSAVGKLYCLLVFLSIAGVILVLLVVFGRFFLHLT